METLQLKDIACFLPYGLKYATPSLRISGLEFNDNGLQIAKRPHTMAYMQYTPISFRNALRDNKPILYPMDLSKTITVEGREITPIVELAKMFGLGDLEKFEDDGETSFGWNEQGIDDSQGFEFAHHKNGSFGVWFDFKDNSDPLYSYCSLDVIEKLYEWKYDVENLIGRGLAVSVYDLPENPYQ